MRTPIGHNPRLVHVARRYRCCLERLEDRLAPADVGNLVFNDRNANGLQDPGEPGVGGARIELFSSINTTKGDADDVSLGSVTTAPDGSYGFTGLDPTFLHYLVFSRPAGAPAGVVFSPKDVGNDDAIDSDVDAAGETDLFNLGLTQVDDTRDAGLVGNVHAPTVSANAAAVQANEGAAATNAGVFDDLDGDVVTISADIGTITQSATAPGTWSWSLPTPNGPAGPFTVTITAADGQGGVATTTFDFTVLNRAPGITVQRDLIAVNEPAGATNAGDFADPGNDQVVITASAGVVTQQGGRTGSWAWSMNGTDGPTDSRTITITATDSDGAQASVNFRLIVNDVPPRLNLFGPTAINRLAPFRLTLGGVVDPGKDVITGYRVRWGDGTATGVIPGSPAGDVLTHLFAQGGVNRTINVDLFDEDGTHLAAGTKSVFVRNAAPNLRVVMTRTPLTAVADSFLSFGLTITNVGNAIATGVFARLQIPAGLTRFNLATTPGWFTDATGRVRINLGALAPGQTRSVRFNVCVGWQFAVGAVLTTVATVGDNGLNGPDANPVNNRTAIGTRVES